MNEHELKEALDELGRSWAEFRKQNDDRLKQIEQRGHASSALEERVNRIGKDLDSLATRMNRTGHGSDWLPEKHKPGTYVSAYDGQEYTEKFAHFVRTGETTDLTEAGKRAFSTKDLSSGSDPDGGYLVTETMSKTITEIVWETTPMRAISNVVAIGNKALEIVQDVNDITAGWVAETGSRNATAAPKLGKKEIPVHELYAMPTATQTLLEDANLDVENWLGRRIGNKFGRMEATAFVYGDGAGKPRGFLTYPAGTNWGEVEQVNSGDANLITADGLVSLVGALKYPYRQRATFLANRGTIADIRKLKDPVTGLYLWQPALQLGQPDQLLGYPIRMGADLPDVTANALPVAFGDFSAGYTIVDRIGIRVLRDPFSSKPYILFYTTKRVGGDVTNFEALKLQKIAA